MPVANVHCFLFRKGLVPEIGPTILLKIYIEDEFIEEDEEQEYNQKMHQD